MKTNADHSYAIIMAGGGGTRLWPLSRIGNPKQMLKLAGNRSLYQMAVDRLAGFLPSDHILVVTVAEQAPILQSQYPAIPPENFLIEPMPRGTASVVGLAAVELWQRDPDATMIVLTADHFIQNVPLFQSILISAAQLAQTGYLVTLGIHPTFPSTGYGYIHRGEEIGVFDGKKAYQVLQFREKPDEVTAKLLLSQGDHEWNSGMFVWQVGRILDEFCLQMPDLYQQLQEIARIRISAGLTAALQEVWHKIIPQTIDYGIMEHAHQTAVIPGYNMGWNDVGSWESLFDVISGDAEGNIVINASHLNLDSNSSLIVSENPSRLIVTLGVDNLVIVDTGKALLVCRRDQSQRVKEIIQKLKEASYNQYL